MNDGPEARATDGLEAGDVPDAEVARARSQVYTLLAAAFDGDVAVLRTAIETGTFDRLATAIPGLDGADSLTGSPLDAEALRAGYDNLFVVPGPHYVPLFASAHANREPETSRSDHGDPESPQSDRTDAEGAFESDSVYSDERGGELLGGPAAAAAGTYERFGFVPTRGSEFPDSLPALLEFAAALAAAETDAADDAERAALRTAQTDFLDEQLQWVDPFADAVADADAVEGVYAGLAAFARAFVAHDQEQLARARDSEQPGRGG